MRCLVTGARGLLGRELVNYLRSVGAEVIEWDIPEHDITEVEKTINEMHSVAPEVIFHLAAWTDVDGCEADPARATLVNFHGTWTIALGVAEIGCKVVYMSTDYVFDGRMQQPYQENTPTAPLSVYGRTKLMGEQAVRRLCKKWFIVRTSWLFGRYGKNFVDTIRQRSLKEKELRVVNDQIGSPTYAHDLCAPLLTMACSNSYGIYHLTNSGWCSWYELACEIIKLTGGDCKIIPITSKESGRLAPRPHFSVLENRNFKRRFGRVLRPWSEALREYLNEV